MMKFIKGFMIAIMSVWTFASAAQAQSQQTCALLLQSTATYSQEQGQTPFVQAHFTTETLTFLRQQYYVSGYLTSILNQFCSWGEPLSSQLAFIFSRVIFQTQGTDLAEGLNIKVKIDEQMSPYTFEPRVATIWVQDVEQQVTMPSIR